MGEIEDLRAELERVKASKRADRKKSDQPGWQSTPAEKVASIERDLLVLKLATENVQLRLREESLIAGMWPYAIEWE